MARSRRRAGSAGLWPVPVIVSCCGICALLATGTGLLAPGSNPGPGLRGAAVGVAAVALVALIVVDGPARSSARLVTVAVVAGIVALATFPVSPVRFTFNDEAFAPGVSEGSGTGVEGSTMEGSDSGPGAGGNAGMLGLPADAEVAVVDGALVMQFPDGTTIVLGDATAPAPADVLAGSADVVVVDGRATRDDGGVIGPGVGVGGLGLESAVGGRSVVVDGALLPVPDPLDPDAAPPPDHTDALLAVMLAAFALLAFAPPIVRFGERLGITLVEPAPPEPEPVPVERTVTMEEGLAEVLRSMLADPDPRTAVIGAYARLLRALAEVGHPRQDQEAPHEHLWRTLGPLGVRRTPVHRLAELFVRARFSPKPITEDHRQRAIGALADALADLRLQSGETPGPDLDELVLDAPGLDGDLVRTGR